MNGARSNLRRILRHLVVADLALLGALVPLWCSSYFVSLLVRRVGTQNSFEVRTDRGGVYLISRPNGAASSAGWDLAAEPASSDDLLWTLGIPVHARMVGRDGTLSDQGWGRNAFLGFNQAFVPGRVDVTVVPFWFVALVSCVFPAWWMTEGRRLDRQHPRGHCPACGYDLRGSATRCPECGRPFGWGPIVVLPPRPRTSRRAPPRRRSHSA